MEMKATNSVQIPQAGYNADTSQLEVIFDNGITFQYDDVTQAQYDDIIAAADQYAAFVEVVKDKLPEQYRQV